MQVRVIFFYQRWKISSIVLYLGVLVVAPTVHQAFDEIYYLERACKIQLLASQAVGGDKEKLSL